MWVMLFGLSTSQDWEKKAANASVREHFPIRVCRICMRVLYLSYLHCKVNISFAHLPVLFYYVWLSYCCSTKKPQTPKSHVFETWEQLHLGSSDTHTPIHEESKPAGKSLSVTTMPKKNSALFFVSCALAWYRQQKSREKLLLIQIPRAKSRPEPELQG